MKSNTLIYDSNTADRELAIRIYEIDEFYVLDVASNIKLGFIPITKSADKFLCVYLESHMVEMSNTSYHRIIASINRCLWIPFKFWIIQVLYCIDRDFRLCRSSEVEVCMNQDLEFSLPKEMETELASWWGGSFSCTISLNLQGGIFISRKTMKWTGISCYLKYWLRNLDLSKNLYLMIRILILSILCQPLIMKIIPDL